MSAGWDRLIQTVDRSQFRQGAGAICFEKCAKCLHAPLNVRYPSPIPDRFDLSGCGALDAFPYPGLPSHHEHENHHVGDYLLDIVSCARNRVPIGVEISIR